MGSLFAGARPCTLNTSHDICGVTLMVFKDQSVYYGHRANSPNTFFRSRNVLGKI